MEKAFSIILTIAFIISSCVSSENTPETSSPTTPTAISTAMQTPTKSPTNTPFPTATHTPSITSTFDPASIITRTPSAPKACPQATDDIQAPTFSQIDFSVITFKDNEQKALDFLNQGGKPETLLKAIKNSGWLNHGEINGQIKDITLDNVAEIIISPSETYVLGCVDAKYQILLKIDNEGIAINHERNRIVAIEDMNLDGVPELAVASYGCGGMGEGMCLDGWIYEWDGIRFTIKSEVSIVGSQLSGAQPLMKAINTNDDQLLELIVTGGISTGLDHYYYFPWRQETDTYVWNGNEFVLQSVAFSSPQFRYQVVQDGDRATLNGEYDDAIKMYQNAIYGNYDWFSEERKQYIIDNASGVSNLIEPDPDPNEQPNLAGYSFFRIMLAYLLQGNLEEAQTAYDRIHKNFAKDSPGYDFVIIADDFWNEYQSSRSIEKSCGKAIAYALDHREFLKYLGSDFHNVFQDIMYGPTDLCPFKE